jgi:rod shape-determining protein MreB
LLILLTPVWCSREAERVLRGIDRYLHQQLGIPVRIAETPRTAVTRGAMICLDHLDRWKAALDDGMRAA